MSNGDFPTAPRMYAELLEEKDELQKLIEARIALGNSELKVIDLIPGSIIDGHTFVAQTVHPIWPHLQLVIWRLRDGTWSHDALSPGQVIMGTLDRKKSQNKTINLRRALLGE